MEIENPILSASVLILNKSLMTKEKITEKILEKEKDIEKMKAKLLLEEDQLSRLKSLTDEDIEEIGKVFNNEIDTILDSLEETGNIDEAKFLRNAKDEIDSPKPS